jgi:hypothetical protein
MSSIYENILEEYKKNYHGNNFLIIFKFNLIGTGTAYSAMSNICDGREFKKMCNDLNLCFLKAPDPRNFYLCEFFVFINLQDYLKNTDYPIYLFEAMDNNFPFEYQ